jgi:hypothetical protein
MTFQELLKKHLSPTDLQRMQDFMASLEPERRAAMMQFIAARETHAPAVGAEAPDFDLPQLGSTERVRLSSFRNHKPVALVFGSFT